MIWGIDIGSVSTNIVLLDEKKTIRGYRIGGSGCRHGDVVKEMMKEIRRETGCLDAGEDLIVGTGYGRRNIPGVQYTYTEITCHAKGVHYFFPKADTVIDIGGQDSKAIRLSHDGGVEDFVMNDRCAAGTGRFLEVMAGVFQMDIETFSRCGLQAAAPYRISSTCTVFAESEVISGIAKGIGAEMLAAGLYDAVVSRITGMALTLGRGRRVALTGGVAKSMGIRRRMEKYFPGLQVPEEPQITGALGAALIGWYKQYGKLDTSFGAVGPDAGEQP